MKILFAGTPSLAAAYLAALHESEHDVVGVITQPDRPGKRGKKLIPSAVKAFAEDHNLYTVQPERLRLDDVEQFQPDVMIVVAYGQILRKSLLEYPPFGCINVHASLLPRWRGAAPIQRSILAGDKKTGVCIMQMDEGLDTGPVYARTEFAIDDSDSSQNLSEKIATYGSNLLLETLKLVETKAISPAPQADVGITYAKKIEKPDALIDWSESAVAIDRLIRAMNPDPVAFTYIGQHRVKIWEAAAQDSSSQGAPGEITSLDKSGLGVACGEGQLQIKRIQVPIGKGSILSPHDILNSRQSLFSTGKIFQSS